MAGKYDHIDFRPTASVAAAAARGLVLRQKAKKSHKGVIHRQVCLAHLVISVSVKVNAPVKCAVE